MKKLLLLFALWCMGVAYPLVSWGGNYKDARGVKWTFYPIDDADETTTGLKAEITYAKDYGTEVEVPGTVYDDDGIAYTVVKMSNVFRSRNSLQKVTLPTSVTVLDGTFEECHYLTTVENMSQITEIGHKTFYECSLNMSINLPLCTKVGEMAFYNCRITSVDLPVCTTVGYQAFYFCTGLTSIKLPVCTTVGCQAFYFCTGLTSIELPACTTMGSNAFENCQNLTSIDLPACTSVEVYTFQDCYSLKSIDLCSCKSVGEYAFSDCLSRISIDLPSCESVEYNAFNGCAGLKSVNLPVCKYVGDSAFCHCAQLESINIPSSVTSIGEYAFAYCYGLTKIHVSWNTPPFIHENVFEGLDKRECTLYVPEGTSRNYKQDWTWNQFGNIVEYETNGIENPDAANGAVETARYSANGQQVAASVKGVNIVKYSDGSTRKVVVK